MDGERLNGEVEMMDRDYKEKLEVEEHVPLTKRTHITREDLVVFGFAARCPGCRLLSQEGARRARTEPVEGGLDRS